MWTRKILVAYDGSAPSHRALELMKSIGDADPSIEIVIVHVIRLVSAGAAAAGIDMGIFDDASDVRDELEDIASDMVNPVTVKLLKGTSPADLIVRCAQDEGCDLILMGSRGKGGIKGYLGSISYAVTQSSPISVLIAK